MRRLELLNVLTDPKVHIPELRRCMGKLTTPAGAPGYARSAAILTALAGMESAYDLEAVGDNGASIGLWQINRQWWGKFGGSKNQRPVDWETLGKQLEMVTPIWCDAVNVIRFAQKKYDVRSLPVHTEGELAQMAWQYGGPAVKDWLSAGPNAFTPQEFVSWRRAQGLSVEPDTRERQERFDRQLEWALANVELTDVPLKERGIFGTAFDYYDERARAHTPGNALGWVVLGGVVIGVAVKTFR